MQRSSEIELSEMFYRKQLLQSWSKPLSEYVPKYDTGKPIGEE